MLKQRIGMPDRVLDQDELDQLAEAWS
jgi:hypothetical protein